MSKRQPPLIDGVHARPLPDGNVEMFFVQGGKKILGIVCDPSQVGGIAAGLLGSASAAFDLADKQLQPQPGKVAVNFVHFSKWAMGESDQKQKLLVFSAGESNVAFAIPPNEMRPLARGLIDASRNLQSAPLAALFREAGKDFLVGIRGWGGVLKARVKASSRRLAISFWERVTGRSFLPLRTIAIPMNSPELEYPWSAGKCIYCGSKIYSETGRASPLGAEHIVAEGLGGNILLRDASCQDCERITGALVENDVIGRTLRPVVLKLKLRARPRHKKPQPLPITVQRNGKDTIQHIEIEDYPVILNIPMLTRPGILPGRNPDDNGIGGMWIKHYGIDLKLLKRKYQIESFSTHAWDTVMFSRLIAKTGHAFAIAELGLDKFHPLLIDLIRLDDNKPNYFFIGGELSSRTKPNVLHEISLGYQKGSNGKRYLVTRVHLFAAEKGPIFYAVVGECSSRIAIWRRLFSNKISSMQPRQKSR